MKYPMNFSLETYASIYIVVVIKGGTTATAALRGGVAYLFATIHVK
jgi:hypothetical protein